MKDQDHQIGQLKSIFEKASQIIEDLPEVIKPRAFQIAVNKLLEAQFPTESPVYFHEPERKPREEKGFFSLMGNRVNIEKMNLESVYKISKKGSLKIVTGLLGGTTADKQRQLAYLYLLGKNVGFEENWVSALELAKQAGSYGINDGHISKSLKTEKGLILHAGTKRGKQYGLTPNGMVRARDVLNDLIK